MLKQDQSLKECMHRLGLILLDKDKGKGSIEGMNKGMDYIHCSKDQVCKAFQEQQLKQVDYKNL